MSVSFYNLGGLNMLKKIFAAMLTVLTCAFTMVISTAFAADDNYELDEFIYELNKFDEPYYGYSPRDFDFNRDDVVDVFDLIYLKNEVISGENPEVTVATVVKLQSWLLGKPGAALSIESMQPEWMSVSEHSNKCQENLMSHDFRFVYAYKANVEYNGDNYCGIYLEFLSNGENIIETVFYPYFCRMDDLDQVIATRDGDGFVIGIKDGEYAIALVD